MNDKQQLQYMNIHYTRFRNDVENRSRGTVLLDKRMIPQYPHIERAYVLEKALKKTFHENEFAVEEKLDGTNIRMVYLEKKEQILAFTRGGFVCPFTTELVNRNNRMLDFFKNFPNLIVCGELVGNNPYNHMSTIYGEDSRILVFDILKARKDPKIDLLLPLQRNELLDRYSIEKIPVFGQKTYHDVSELQDLVISLNGKQHEGLVFKATDKLNPRIKFITFYASAVAIADYIAKRYQQAAPSPLNRFFLAACYLNKIDAISSETASSTLGGLILDRLQRAVDKQEVSEVYQIEISPVGWNILLERMRNHVDVQILEKKDTTDGRLVIRFKKIYRSSTDKIKEYLKGNTFVD